MDVFRPEQSRARLANVCSGRNKALQRLHGIVTAVTCPCRACMTVFRPEQTSASLARGPNGGKKRMQTRAAARQTRWAGVNRDRIATLHVPEWVVGSLAGSVEVDASALGCVINAMRFRLVPCAATPLGLSSEKFYVRFSGHIFFRRRTRVRRLNTRS
jgi:hypothetical protein